MTAPLDRTWYNTLVDDTGTGTTGTVWNKAAVDSLLDAVDASLATIVDKTGTPVGNQLAIFNDTDTLKATPSLLWEPAFSQVVIRGTAAGTSGSRLAFQETDQPANQQWMRIDHLGQTIRIRAVDDGGNVVIDPITAARTGDVTIGRALTVTGGAVSFPATAIPSANATTLDDYREITWTPYFAGSLGNSGTTYTGQFGRGVKVGRLVTLWVAISVATPGTISGSLQLWGLPLLSAGDIASMGTVTIGAFSPTNATFAFVSGYVPPAATVVNLTYVAPGGGSELLPLPGTAVKAGTTIYCEIRYYAAA